MLLNHSSYHPGRAASALCGDRAFGSLRANRSIDGVTVFIFAAAFSLSVLITALGMIARNWSAPLANASSPAEFNFTVAVDGPRSKEQFLARVSSAERREMAATVHYVSDIIARKAKRLNRSEAHRLAQHIVVESKRQNFDPLFVAAVIKSESTFNKQAVSNVGALGLMQILPDTGKYISRKNSIDWLGETKLTDPSYNIRLGIAYLKYLEGYFGQNREHILVAYNWGPGNMLSALKKQSNLPSGPKNYARTIMRDHSKWQREYVDRAQEFQFLEAGSLLG
jgi:soluble lytic murein transglycosylase-like protein